MRVMRNITAANDLIAGYPSLKQKSLDGTLTDSERRLFLDLPDEEMEAINISAATSLSREQLILKALSDRANLTKEELVILQDRFWTPQTNEENSKIYESIDDEEALEDFENARLPAYVQGELEAFGIGSSEYWKRELDRQSDKQDAAAQLALPYAKEWIQHLYEQGKKHWGFVCFFDAAAQKLGSDLLDDFQAHADGFFEHALEYNGSKDIIDKKWAFLSFNSPKSAFAPITASTDNQTAVNTTNNQNAEMFRDAFRRLLRDPQEYEKVENPMAEDTALAQLKDGISLAESGVLTNTFLVIDPICINSVLPAGNWYDDMRILAFEADFPVEGRKYVEGYQGFTWVRMDQLVYYFYELRLMKADRVGMDEIWKAAQDSRNGAFVSMDPGEAQSFTASRGFGGITPDSVLGKKWYAMMDARKKNELWS